MSSGVSVKCKSPHEFLVSIVYSLSYASTVRGPVLQPSLLELGYVFTALDVPWVYNIPAPDFLLINTQRKVVIAVECKGEATDDTGLERKFSSQVVDAIRSIVRDHDSEYKIEFVIHTFDIYGDYYSKVARVINEKLSNDVLIWTTTSSPQIKAGEAPGGYTEHYTLKKYTSPEYSVNHSDKILDEMLTRGILVSENDIVCNPLVDPNVGYQILFYVISEYVLQAALSDRYRGRRVMMTEFVYNIKRDYQSPVKTDRIIRVVIDILSVFPRLGEIKAGGAEIEFKKMPRIDITDFDNIRQKILSMSDKEARNYVRELGMKRRSSKR